MLLIYDGDCGFCTSSAAWFARRAQDPDRIAPWQSLDLDEYGLTERQVAESVYWVDGDQVLSGADAAAAAMKTVPGPWRLTGHVLAFPGVIQLGRIVYPIVARNRHRLPGSTDACKL